MNINNQEVEKLSGKVLETRSERFVDRNQICEASNLNQLQCFYQGDIVHKRMEAVRKSIYYIRENWHKFDQFMNNLKNFYTQEAQPNGGLSDAVKEIFKRKRNWYDVEENTEMFSAPEEEFILIKTYTTVEGFKEIFKVVDNIFRDDSSVNFNDKILNTVFLIELINIDLFNYVHKYPKYQSFEGIVYRRMAVSKDSFDVLEKLMRQPIEKRYISIPLGLWSFSLDMNVAVQFVREELEKNSQSVPLLMKIQVLNLEDEHLQCYREKYKQSIVSTICAVYIGDISKNKEDKEIILRGGFYQALKFYFQNVDGIDFKVLDLVMLNTNRDHLSNPIRLGVLDDEARVLFGNMVGFNRNKFIVNYCQENNLIEDLGFYEKALSNNEKKLKELIQ